ncbi:hypothetical protein Tco_0875948 [Tanacetum coccineum]|uniref:Uncharacterized protein n=1 Tax=Tanacetum coccineum TaxID=301880 RepID=A0ABQ5BTN0_9ASTR
MTVECSLEKEREVHAIKEIEKWLNESKMQNQEGMVNEGVALDVGLDSKVSTYDNTSTKQYDGSNSSGYDADAERALVDKTAQTLHMLLPKEDSVHTGKQGLGFENKNDVENPFVLNKAKEIAPSLYNIDKIGKDSLFDHKIMSEKELKCEAKKCLKVKQRQSSLSYQGFVYGLTQFEEPPKVPLKRIKVNFKKTHGTSSTGKL